MNYFNQQTERLKFRKLSVDDIEIWTDFFTDNDRLRFLGLDLSKSAEIHAKEWIEKQLERYENDNLGLLALELKENNELIGVCGIIPRILNEKEEFEIGYSILPRYWKRGYASEAAVQMRLFGFENVTKNRIISIIHKENIDSMNVAVKNGMKILFETEFQGMDVFIYGIEK